jgi:hypothetical protein
MTNNLKPLVLLDVDGVINDLGAIYGATRPWRVDRVDSHGFAVLVPDYMPALIQHLASMAEVYWCTTWREKANDEIASHLGVGPFPVVDDGTQIRAVSWKAAAAHRLAATALAQGRRVVWIEDFYGELPIDQMPGGVEYVDTGRSVADAVLLPEQVADLLARNAA